MNKGNVVVATIRPWNIERYHSWTPPPGFKKYLISEKEKLTYAKLQKLNPRYIFFPHWSWVITPQIYENFECVIFHETDLPFGRGGSPLQNLIVRGIYRTKISAIRAVKEVDAGSIYLKRSLDLSSGSARVIFERVSVVVFSMIDKILADNPKPKPQRGKVVIFKRRKPEMSRVPANLTSRKLYDFIRMLDAEGYPRAFIEHNGYRLEFCNVRLNKDSIEADVLINKEYEKK